MSHLLILDYLRNLQDCWNCGKKVMKGKKCPTCGALPERPRVYAEESDWAKDRPDK